MAEKLMESKDCLDCGVEVWRKQECHKNVALKQKITRGNSEKRS
jgi:hypothetical protein